MNQMTEQIRINAQTKCKGKRDCCLLNFILLFKLTCANAEQFKFREIFADFNLWLFFFFLLLLLFLSSFSVNLLFNIFVVFFFLSFFILLYCMNSSFICGKCSHLSWHLVLYAFASFSEFYYRHSYCVYSYSFPVRLWLTHSLFSLAADAAGSREHECLSFRRITYLLNCNNMIA